MGTIAEASALTGYTVAVPGFVPEGFVRRERQVTVTQLRSQDLAPIVKQKWVSPTSPQAAFELLQAPGSSGLGGETEPTTIGGHEGVWQMIPADDQRSFSILVLSWADNPTTVNLTAFPQGALTGAVLYEIASSVCASQ